MDFGALFAKLADLVKYQLQQSGLLRHLRTAPISCEHLVFEVLLAFKLVQWLNDLILYLFDAWIFKSAFAEDFLHLSKVSKGGCKKQSIRNWQCL